MRKHYFVSILLIFLFACQHEKQSNDYLILRASLEETEVSMNDLFSKVEVLPLETNDSCLLVFPYKLLLWDDYYAVFDYQIPCLFIYDSSGKFVRRIGSKGQGPGEYTFIYDALRDTHTGEFQLLSPFGEIFCYSSEGSFLKKIKLPQKYNYWAFEDYGDYWITWSYPGDDNDPGVSFISKRTLECEHSWWFCNRSVNSLMETFYRFNNDVYFTRPMNRNVYKLTGADSLQIVYAWDFGSGNYSVNQWGFSETKWGGVEEGRLVERYLIDGVIPYCLGSQTQTDKFYYCRLVMGFDNRNSAHLFYRKSDGKNVYFETTSEGLHFKPMYWGEDYVISISDEGDMLDLDIYKAFLSPSEYTKIANRKEDDNPFLLKCYYK